MDEKTRLFKMMINNCSVCGKEFATPIECNEKICDGKIITMFCHDCFSKSKNGKKITNQMKYLYSEKNLMAWK